MAAPVRGSSTAAVAAVTAASAAASVAMALDVTRVDELLTTGRLGRRFHYCEEIDSTMTWAAKAMAEADDPLDLSGSVFVAEIQTAGIGRRGRAWESKPKGNVYMTVCLAPPARPDGSPAGAKEMFLMGRQLNFATPVAVARAVREAGVDAVVKWPNDVYVGRRKMSGILVNIDRLVVVGVGINVHEDVSGDPVLADIATSVDLELQRVSGDPDATADREALVAGVLNHLEALTGPETSFDALMEAWTELDMLQGTRVRVHHAQREVDHPDDYTARVVGVNAATGSLVIERAGGDGTPIELHAEEISLTPLGDGDAGDADDTVTDVDVESSL